MQQKAATPSNHITENQLIKSEYEGLDNTPKEENGLQKGEEIGMIRRQEEDV